MNRTISLYKIDAKGKTREWFSEWGVDENGFPAWRVHSGIKDGKMVLSGWKVVKAKNVGRSNATTAEQQAEKAARAKWQRQKDSGYCEDLSNQISPPRPMLAKKFEGCLDQVATLQPKLDGVRVLARADGLWSRTGKRMGPSVDHIWEQLQPFFENNPDMVIDGEVYNHSHKDDFNGLISLIRKEKLNESDKTKVRKILQYHMYDSWVEGVKQKYDERWKQLPQESGSLRRVIYYTKKVSDALEDHLKYGYEGSMVRVVDMPYENKRSKGLLKVKKFHDAEFQVLRVESGVGNWSGKAKRIVVDYNGKEVGCGIRGTEQEMKDLLGRVNGGEMPKQATVRYFEVTNDGSLRFPVVTQIWWNGRDL